MRWLRRRDPRRAALLEAIALAAEPGLFVGSSRTDGLRAVRYFEELNGVQFDPRCLMHRIKVSNSGWFFRLQRRLRELERARAARPAPLGVNEAPQRLYEGKP
jgi:hypothetical protein